MTAYAFFIGWGFVFIGGWALSKSDTGKRAVYYTLWAAIALLLFTRSSDIMTFIKATGLSLAANTENTGAKEEVGVAANIHP